MDADAIRAELMSCQRLPDGRIKAERLESLAESAKLTGDHALEAEVLLDLGTAYVYGAERARLPVVLGRMLSLLDRFPAEVGRMSGSIHWELKWMTNAMIKNPDVPLATVRRWLDELTERYRERGYSLRPVHGLRAWLALDTGDLVLASQQMEASIAAARDRMADCEACERSGWGSWRVRLDDDDGALEYWAPVLDGTLTCAREPHAVLAQALLPLLRTGQHDAARGAFLRGYQLVRHDVSMPGAVAEHLEFCALTGNEARGLEILAEHSTWITGGPADASERLSFIAGVCVLLRRLASLGYGELAAGAGQTVASALAVLEPEVAELAGRFDARYGTTATSERVAHRWAREPLLRHLLLGSPARLPGPNDHAGASVVVGSGEDLTARAMRLAHQRHPHTGQAWEQVAAAGRDLTPEVTARIARSRGGDLLRTDPAAAHQALLNAAGQFAALGDRGRELESRASAAFAQVLAGDLRGGQDAAGAAIAEAEREFGQGTIAAREYLATRATAPRIAMAAEPHEPAGLQAIAELLGGELACAQELGELRYEATFHELLARVSSLLQDRDRLAAHLTQAVTCYLEAGEPWHAANPESLLAQLTLGDGDQLAAEMHARAALEHGTGFLDAEHTAKLHSVVALALGAQEGRQLEFIEASLAAADRWDGLSEPDALHNTFNAARAYAGLRRPGEAAALFAAAMPRVHIPYDPVVVAMTREQYGDTLRQLGRHREAATEFLEAARIVQDDQNNVPAHARLARAAADMLAECDAKIDAIAAYERAAELFGRTGDVAARVRSLRSAAWVRFWLGSAEAAQAALGLLRAVLSELAAIGEPSQSDTAELAATQEQLTKMATLAAGDPDTDRDTDPGTHRPFG